MAFPEALEALDEVDSAVLEGADVALSQVMLPHPVFTDEEAKAQTEKLKATEWAQPALGAAELATLAVMDELGHFPMSEHPEGFAPFFADALARMPK